MKPKKQCNYCHVEFDHFIAYHGGSANRPRNMALLETVGSNIDEFACPSCGAHDRERHLKLYCDRLKLYERFKGGRILHFAPEKHFMNYIGMYKPELHLQADLFSSAPEVLPLNAEAIPYDDQTFDFVIANHILEHVSDVGRALSEINRVLKVGGSAILQTPFSKRLFRTFEDPGIDSEALRLEFYGQEDHVRLFGQDIFERFGTFLQCEVVSHAEVFGDADTTSFGINPNEPLFLFRHKVTGSEREVPQTLPTQEQIRQGWRDETPLVSIFCTTYNHEAFIAETLEGFLMQQTDFAFEILVGEDCSTDRTREVIDSYRERYPDLIRLIAFDENVGRKANTHATFAACRGKYVAKCEGDDYWTDPLKLQKQVQYLEAHPECVITYGAVQAFDENGIDYGYVGGALCDISAENLQKTTPINTLTTCFRKVVDKLPVEHYVAGYGDLFIWSILGGHGGGHYIDAILPSRYRIHVGGVHSTQSQEKKHVMLAETYFALYLYYKRLGNAALTEHFYDQTAGVILNIYSMTPYEHARELLAKSIGEMTKRCKDLYSFDGSEYLALMEPKNLALRLDQATAPEAAQPERIDKKRIAFLADPLDSENFLDLTMNVLSPLANLKAYGIDPLLKKSEGRYRLNLELLAQVSAVIVYDKAAYLSHLLPQIKACGIPVLFYIATDVWHVDVKHSAKEALDLLQPHYLECMRHADVIVAANEYLSRDINLPTEVITPFIDPSPWQMPVEQLPRESDKFIVAVYVDMQSLNDISMITKFMQTVQKKYADELKFVVYGINCSAIEMEALTFVNVKMVQIENYIQYVDFVRSQPVDLVLTPLIANEHNQTVTPFNYFVQSLCGVAGVYSNWGLYREVVEHGVTGFLCDEKELDWEAAIVTLMRDPQLRQSMAEAARKQVMEHFTIDHTLRTTHDLFERLNRYEPAENAPSAALQKAYSRYDLEAHMRYPSWCAMKSLRPVDVAVWEGLSQTWQEVPEFHLFLRVDANALAGLADTIESLVGQLYPQWHLYIISSMESPDPSLENHAKLHWIQTEASVYDAINHVAAQMQNAMIGFLQPGDKLLPHALAAYTQLRNSSGADLIYADHDTLDEEGRRVYPQFKPDFNLDMLRSKDYVGRSFVITSQALVALDGINTELTDCELYDLILRYYDRFGETAIGHCSDVLHTERTGDADVVDLGTISKKLALKQHLVRQGIAGDVVDGPDQSFRLLYHHEATPLVSIIIPTKNQYHFLRPCIDSLLEKTAYRSFEIIIVDNGSDEADAVSYLETLSGHEQVTVVPYNEPFNYSAANNLGARHAKGEFLLLLNNDTEVLHENWLDVLLSYGQRSDVGIVGPRLIYPNQTIQHAGVIVGLSGIADHQFVGSDLQDPGYMSRLQIDQNLTAVTAAALLIKRSVFDTVAGLNETDYIVNFSDVDLCLKVVKTGYRIVYTPHATLLHHGSVSQKQIDPEKAKEKARRFKHDQDAFRRQWAGDILHDQAYNVNLDTGDPMMNVRTKAMGHWNPLLRTPVPKILGMARGHDGGGFYRVVSPLGALQDSGKALTHHVYKNYLAPYMMMLQPDIIVYQTPLHDNMLNYLELVKTYYPEVTLIFEIDDLLTNIPIDNRAFHNQYKDSKKRIQRAMKYCDRMVVSTQPLKEAFAEFSDDIRVVPNYLPQALWCGLESRRNRSDRLRVGWAGSIFHKGDLAIIKQLITTYRDEVEWVFFGMAPEGMEGDVEFHPGVSLEQYPEKLATLDLDLALVPLEQNAFNEAKSNLRLLEFGILGWPVICSDVYPYQDAPVTRVKNRFKDWERAFKEKIAQPELLAEEGRQLKAWVEEHYILEDHLDFVYEQYTAR